ncbi:MAG: hypothetical protein B7Y39_01935 [Bdellovibrio sp. 28-41-41]|nr:MAG: hypothetical protein B7Y39_01935 [Bdellovibrio sp. 28-41-41]
MANQNKLAHWLYSNKSVFNPKFTELDWTTTYFPGLYDFATKITFGEKIAEGRGIDLDRVLALEKSVSEAIERLIFYRTQKSFLGFAVGGRNGADNHAYCEALERYFIFSHLKDQVSFKKIYMNLASSNSKSEFAEFLKRMPDVNVSFYAMAASAPYFGIVCQIVMNNSFDILGFALTDNLEESVTKSFREALANFAWYHSTQSSLSTNSDNSFKNPAHMGTEFLSKIIPLLGKNDTELSIPIPELERTEIDLDDFYEFKNCPITPVGYRVKGLEVHLW